MTDVAPGDLLVCSYGLYRIVRLTPQRAYVDSVPAIKADGARIREAAYLAGYSEQFAQLGPRLQVTTEEKYRAAVREYERRSREVEAAKDRYRELGKARDKAVSEIIA